MAMRSLTPSRPLLAIAIVSFYFLPSCNNRTVDIPFPVSDSSYPQPLSQPLVFTAPKKISWVTIKTGKISPSVKKLDINTLPSNPYDPSGFVPFVQAPETVHVNFRSLHDSAFHLENIAALSLEMKSYL